MEGRHVDPLGVIYAQALADAADAEGGHDLLRRAGTALSALGDAWGADRTLRAYLMSAQVAPEAKRSALERLSSSAPPIVGRFLGILHRRGRLDRLPVIAEALEALLDERLGRVLVQLTTATPVPEDRVQGWLDTIRESTGREPVLQHAVRPELLAGGILQVGGRSVDWTARRLIAEFQNQILERGSYALEA